MDNLSFLVLCEGNKHLNIIIIPLKKKKIYNNNTTHSLNQMTHLLIRIVNKMLLNTYNDMFSVVCGPSTLPSKCFV